MPIRLTQDKANFSKEFLFHKMLKIFKTETVDPNYRKLGEKLTTGDIWTLVSCAVNVLTITNQKQFEAFINKTLDIEKYNDYQNSKLT